MSATSEDSKLEWLTRDRPELSQWVEMVRSLPCSSWFRVLPAPMDKPFMFGLVADALADENIEVAVDLSHAAISLYLVRRVCRHES